MRTISCLSWAYLLISYGSHYMCLSLPIVTPYFDLVPDGPFTPRWMIYINISCFPNKFLIIQVSVLYCLLFAITFLTYNCHSPTHVHFQLHLQKCYDLPELQTMTAKSIILLTKEGLQKNLQSWIYIWHIRQNFSFKF